MTLRENVILSLTVTAALGAGLHYAFEGLRKPEASPEPIKTDFSDLMTKVQVTLKQGELTGRENQVLAAATTRWLHNPLRERPVSVQSVKLPSLPKYTGFINIGSRPIAIIDGNDYRQGEAIEGGEFTLSQIDPDHIELLRDGAKEPIKVPLENAQLTGESQ